MHRVNQILFASSIAVILFLGASQVVAQNAPGDGRQGNRQSSRQGAGRSNQKGGGRSNQNNFDPAQFQQRMLERYRERLEIADDAEWKTIEPLIQKVLEARMAGSSAGRGGPDRGGRPGSDRGQPDRNDRRALDPMNLAADRLQKAIDAKAPSAEVRVAVARYLETRRVRQSQLERAQSALRAVLTPRQEGIAVLSGLL